MQQFATRADKPNDPSDVSRPDIPAGAQTAYCPHCERELRAQGHYDENGDATTLWWCASHSYVDQPVFDGGDGA